MLNEKESKNKESEINTIEKSVEEAYLKIQKSRTKLKKPKKVLIIISIFYFPMQIMVWSFNSNVQMRCVFVFLAALVAFSYLTLYDKIEQYETEISFHEFLLQRQISLFTMLKGIELLRSNDKDDIQDNEQID